MGEISLDGFHFRGLERAISGPRLQVKAIGVLSAKETRWCYSEKATQLDGNAADMQLVCAEEGLWFFSTMLNFLLLIGDTQHSV